jgi:chloride channel 3/4/5
MLPTNPDRLLDGEQYELADDGQLRQPYTQGYKDGASIDWPQEEMAERDRQQTLKSQAGVRGILLPIFEAARGWIVIILTGLGVGIAGAWLDVLVKWYVTKLAINWFTG